MKTQALAILLSLLAFPVNVFSDESNPTELLIVDLKSSNGGLLNLTKLGSQSPPKRVSIEELKKIGKILESSKFVREIGADRLADIGLSSFYYLRYGFMGNEVLRTGDFRRYYISLDFRIFYHDKKIFELEEEDSELLKKQFSKHVEPSWKPIERAVDPNENKKQNPKDSF